MPPLMMILFILMLSNAQVVRSQYANRTNFTTGNETSQTIYEWIEKDLYNVTGVRAFPSELDTEARIIGGSDAFPHSWPWQVSLRFATMHTCGGAIISFQWVVTAAHCFLKYKDPMFWTAMAGKYDLDNPNEACGQARNLAVIIRHPSYEQVNKVNDVALVKLIQPFTFNECVRPIGVLSRPLPLKRKCTVTGWGSTSENGPFVSRLQEVNITILPYYACNSYYYGRITSQMFCAGEKAGAADACQGDSGGPMSCFSGLRYELAGVVSWGVGCGRANKPGVYTNLQHYTSWMSTEMKRYANDNHMDVYRSSDQCGRAVTKPCKLDDAPAEVVVVGRNKQRVLNVTTACPYSWPWQVSLQHDDAHYCSGVLIDPRWVLASKRCLCTKENDVVVLGVHNLGFMPSQAVPVEEVINLEGGGGFPPAFDLSLIRLSDPARIGHTIAPLCIHNEEDDPDESWSCVTTGWGCTYATPDVNPDILHQARINIVNRTACRAAWGEELILNSHICVSPAASPSCMGDLGRPLYCLRHGIYNLVGMATWSRKTCDRNKPAVFTRVSAFYPWIKHTMNG